MSREEGILSHEFLCGIGVALFDSALHLFLPIPPLLLPPSLHKNGLLVLSV